MSYEMTFEFDLVIPAEKVEEMEREFFRVLQEDDDPVYEEGEFCTHFNGVWAESLASEERPVPLMALASGSTRGDVHIHGVAYKKWRGWEEGMLESLERYVRDGGHITAGGDEDYRINWDFDGQVMYRDDEEYIRESRLRELEAKEKELETVKLRLEKAETMLTDITESFSSLRLTYSEAHSIAKKINAFLKPAPPLEQLAECAE